MTNLSQSVLTVYDPHARDLPLSALAAARAAGVVAWDCETSGLDWRRERLATCQVYIPNDAVYLVRVHDVERPPVLRRLLTDPAIIKLFHHAMFDLRFMAWHWRTRLANIACTRMASKILEPERTKHGLGTLLRDHLGISIPKGMATSDWFAHGLTAPQVTYAVNDVLYLPDLYATLTQQLFEVNRHDMAIAAFAHIPARVQLDLIGAGDVFVF